LIDSGKHFVSWDDLKWFFRRNLSHPISIEDIELSYTSVFGLEIADCIAIASCKKLRTLCFRMLQQQWTWVW
jgi:hypothetical protein